MNDKHTPGFVDYPPHPKDVAIDDLVSYRGEWRRVTEHIITLQTEWAPAGILLGNKDTMEQHDFPCARIAAPLLDALKKLGDHPYR